MSDSHPASVIVEPRRVSARLAIVKPKPITGIQNGKDIGKATKKAVQLPKPNPVCMLARQKEQSAAAARYFGLLKYMGLSPAVTVYRLKENL